MERTTLGEILRKAGLVDDEALRAARAEQERTGRRLGEILVRRGVLREADLVRAVSRRLGVPGAHLEGKAVDPEVLALLPAEMARRLTCLPLFTRREEGGEVLLLGMQDPGDLDAVEAVRRHTGCEVRPVLVGPLSLRRALDEGYGAAREGAGATGPEAEDAPRGGEAASRRAPRAPDADTAPILPCEEPAAPAVEPSRAAPAPAGVAARRAERPREVPTRDILRALTRLLIDKEMIGREELLRAVSALREEAPRRGSPRSEGSGSA